jgi:hypothetical protein
MATAQHGSITGVLVNGYDLSPFLNSVNESEVLDLAEGTAFGSLGAPVQEKEYVAGLGDATLDVAGKYVVDPTGLNQDQVAEVLESAIRAASKPVVDILRWGDGFGNGVHGYLADVNEYGPSASITSIVAVAAKFQASAAIDAMNVLHPLAQEASPGTNGTDLDAGAGYDSTKWKGAVAHLHVTRRLRRHAVADREGAALDRRRDVGGPDHARRGDGEAQGATEVRARHGQPAPPRTLDDGSRCDCYVPSVRGPHPGVTGALEAR